MTTRKLVIGLAAVLLIAMLVPVAFADTTASNPVVPANNPATLTQEQVEEVKPNVNKLLDAKKELFQKYVDMGVITKEEADARLEWMEQNQANRLQEGYAPGLGGKGRGVRGCGGGGCGGYGNGGCNFGAPIKAAPTTANQL